MTSIDGAGSCQPSAERRTVATAERAVIALRLLLYPLAASAEAMFDSSATRSDVVASRRVLSADRNIEAGRGQKDSVELAVPCHVRRSVRRMNVGLNPKVRYLVIALNHAGVRTTLSGDCYSDDLISGAPQAARLLEW